MMVAAVVLKCRRRGYRAGPVVAARLLKRSRSPVHLALTPGKCKCWPWLSAARPTPRSASCFIGEGTVKTHLLHSYAKLGVDDRTPWLGGWSYPRAVMAAALRSSGGQLLGLLQQ